MAPVLETRRWCRHSGTPVNHIGSWRAGRTYGTGVSQPRVFSLNSFLLPIWLRTRACRMGSQGIEEAGCPHQSKRSTRRFGVLRAGIHFHLTSMASGERSLLDSCDSQAALFGNESEWHVFHNLVFSGITARLLFVGCFSRLRNLILKDGRHQFAGKGVIVRRHQNGLRACALGG